LRARAGAIIYSYKKAGIEVSRYESAFEGLFGEKPYGLEREVSEEQVKGETGIQERLEQSLGEESSRGHQGTGGDFLCLNQGCKPL